MTTMEIADELFQCGKQVKQCFANQISKYLTDTVNGAMDFNEYLRLLKQLQILYHSLGEEMEALDMQVQEVVALGENLSDISSAEKFMYYFSNICNKILIHTIKFRKKYCIIQRNDRIPGIGSHVITNLGQILFSLDNGYIPVIDTVNPDNMFTRISRERSVNAWELYFQQPMSVGIDVAGQAAEIRLLDGIPDLRPNDSMDCLLNSGLMGFWRQVMRKYMPLSPEMENYTERLIRGLPFAEGKKIAGVLCRGTDYVNMRPHGHPVQPSLEHILSDIETLMEKQQCDFCYLVTEDQVILETLKSRFGNQLLTTQEIYYPSDSAKNLTSINDEKQIDVHQKNVEYLAALVILSKCHIFIGGRTSGTVVSTLLSDGFEQIHIWNEGRYGIDDMYTMMPHIL